MQGARQTAVCLDAKDGQRSASVISCTRKTGLQLGFDAAVPASGCRCLSRCCQLCAALARGQMEMGACDIHEEKPVMTDNESNPLKRQAKAKYPATLLPRQTHMSSCTSLSQTPASMTLSMRSLSPSDRYDSAQQASVNTSSSLWWIRRASVGSASLVCQTYRATGQRPAA